MTTLTNLATTATERNAAAAQAAKDRLARLMATENITVEHDPRAQTAMFNVETRTLVMPVWRDMPVETGDMLIAHEVSHALHTPVGRAALEAALKRIDPKRPMAAKDYLNVTEDVRIERLMKARFPGTRADFAAGYRWMMQRDLFGIRGKDLKTLALIDRANLQYKIGWLVTIPFTAEELPLVQKVAEAVTFDDAVEAAKALYDLAREQAKRNPPPPPPPPPPTDDEEDAEAGTGAEGDDDRDEGDENEDEATPTDGDGDEDGDGDAKADGDEDGDDAEAPTGRGRTDTEADETDGDDEVETGGRGGEKDPTDEADEDLDGADAEGETDEAEEVEEDEEDEVEAPKPTTTTNVDEALRGMTDAGAALNVYVDLPKPTGLVIDRKAVQEDLRKWAKVDAANAEAGRKAYLAWREANLNAVQLLGMEFDRRKAADEHRRTLTADTGILDPLRLAYYRTSDEVFLTNAVVKDGKNHGVMLLLDLSGSITNILTATVVQMVTLAHFCRRSGIPFRFYGFTDRGHLKNGFEAGAFGGEMIEGRLVTFLDDRMTQAEFTETCGLLLALAQVAHGGVAFLHDAVAKATRYAERPWWIALGGTPTNAALLGMATLAEEFKRTNNLQIVNVIVLTDGEPTDTVTTQVTRTEAWTKRGLATPNDYYEDKPVAKVMWRDPMTKKTYGATRVGTMMNGKRYMENLAAEEQTALLAQVIRDRTGGKVVCIHLQARVRGVGKWLGELATRATGKPEVVKATDEKWLNEGWCTAKGVRGYDEYICVRGENAETTVALTGNAGTAAGLRTLRAQFKKGLAATKANRPLLARVAELVATKG